MNVMFVMHWVKIYVGSSLFFFYHRMVRTLKMSFYKRKLLFEISGTLPTPRKASGSVLQTMWSFNSNKHIFNQLPIVA